MNTTTQTQMGNGLYVDYIMWNSGSIAQRISYAQSLEDPSIIFDGKAVKGWKQLPLKIRRQLEKVRIN